MSKKRIGEFENLEIVAVEYDRQTDVYYESGTFLGIVVRKQPGRMKVLFIHENLEIVIAWLDRHRGDRWIDRTFAAIVTVADATSSQREDLVRRLPPERLKRLLTKERRRTSSALT